MKPCLSRGISTMFAFWHCFGVHAGETSAEIIMRKGREIEANGGWTLWSFSGRTRRTLETWASVIHGARPNRVLALCSRSRNAVDPKGTPALAREFRCPGRGVWCLIPTSIKVPHPFGSRTSAAAFRVSRVLDPSGIRMPSRYEWLCIRDGEWRTDSVPTRGEYLMRPRNGTMLRQVAAVLELQEPFVVEIRR
jgi:hypothetical protein